MPSSSLPKVRPCDFFLRKKNLYSSLRRICLRAHEGWAGGIVDDLEALLKLGVDVNVQDHLGNSALHYASAAGHVQAVSRLLANNKIQVNVANNMGDTPLHKVCLSRSQN